MKIGIISKPEHAKDHAQALRNMGHTVHFLGSKAIDFPDSYDLFVCRTESISHQAYWDAAQAARNGRHVIFENGLTRIIEGVLEFEKNQNPPAETEPMLIPMPDRSMTVEKKLLNAIREVGIFHPKIEITDEQFEALHALKLIRSIDKAMEAYHEVGTIPMTSWPKPFNAIRRSKSFHTYPMWKEAGEGAKKVHTKYEMASDRVLTDKQIEKAAAILGMTSVEPTTGRFWPPRLVPPAPTLPPPPGVTAKEPKSEGTVLTMPSMTLTAIIANDENVVIAKPTSEPTLTPVVEPAPVAEVPKEAEVISIAPVESSVVAPEEVLSGKILATKPSRKADIKELIAMLHEALIDANVETLTLDVSKENGPKVNYRQVVRIVKEFNSFDDLV